ncbi:MAG: cyclase family protein [Thermoprotei archaeon]
MTEEPIGALSFISPEVVLSAIQNVRKGEVLSLAQTLENGIPVPDFHGPFVMTTHRSVEGTLHLFEGINNNRLGSVVCRYELADHTGTHLDALNHASEGYEMYAGFDAREIVTDTGTLRLGVHTLPPIVTRGVLIDLPGYYGVDMLDEEYEIKPGEIQAVLAKHGVTLKRGDAALINTGFSKLWMKDNARYLGYPPGVGEDSAEWLAAHKISVAGTDTSSFDVVKRKSDKLYPCHQILIKRNGIPLIENLKLEELCKVGVYEFLFICAPLKFKGGAGSPVTPIAVY